MTYLPLHHQFEIINIERRRERIEELCLLIERITESMRSSRWDGHVVSELRVDVLAIFDVEADCALRDEESLVVHFVPVRWGTARVRGEGELCGAEAVVFGRC